MVERDSDTGGFPAPLTVGERLVTFRAVTPEDDELLHRVYAGTRADELAQTPWNDAQKEAFTRMQFQAQTVHYRQHHPTRIMASSWQTTSLSDGCTCTAPPRKYTSLTLPSYRSTGMPGSAALSCALSRPKPLLQVGPSPFMWKNSIPP